MMKEPAAQHPDNATGDFYVECDRCVSCEAPYAEAPDLMGRPGSSDKNYGCFFRKQPMTADEVDRACSAVSVSCVEAVRYGGGDQVILRKLYELGAYSSCDMSPTEVERKVIDHAQRFFALAAKHGINWTFICESNPEQTVVACCYGGRRQVLGIFAVDTTTHEVTLVTDDRKYRPKRGLFTRPTLGIWRWLPFTQRRAT